MEYVCQAGEDRLSLGLYIGGIATPHSCQELCVGPERLRKSQIRVSRRYLGNFNHPYMWLLEEGELKPCNSKSNGKKIMAILVTKGEYLPDENRIVLEVKKLPLCLDARSSYRIRTIG